MRRERPLAGILGYSGRLIAPELLAGELRSRPPVLLVHGTEDPLVPFESMAQAETALKGRRRAGRDAGLPGHRALDRSRRGCSAAACFLREVLSAPAG